MPGEDTRDVRALASKLASLASSALPFLPLVVVTALLARTAIAGILAKLHHPGAPLDDSYIHFQYARAIAEGHPLRFQAGEPVTSGATSLLWPLMLAPFYLVGFRGEAILWPAWALSFVALGMLAYETYCLAKRLTGATIAVGAAAMVLAFGGFAWSAASGMEVVPFAWAFARAVRRASEWREVAPEGRTRRRGVELAALAWVAALLRPEGALAALFIAATLAAFPRKRDVRAYGLAASAALGAVVTPLLLLALTGHTTSNTTVVKLMVGNPYYRGDVLYAAVERNVRQLFAELLNGDTYSAEFIPHGGVAIAVAGISALVIVGWREGVRWRTAGILMLALAMLAPCFYVTFLWNRLRYLWPFATGWFIGIACLARLLGDVCGSVRARWRLVGPLACGVVCGMLASKLEWVLEDVAQSASGIDRQQVALGLWAKENLPAGSRIGVNDTGAIAYFGDHPTFDVVGLTSDGEARYWVAGAGSRLEHYERLLATAPDKLPTHFIVYPEWMACEAVLGRQLHEAVVTDSSILGGQSMRAYEASYALLGSGELPWSAREAEVIDAVDVADLESEATHAYQLLDAHDAEETARLGSAPDGALVVDGGRTSRTRERFVAKLRPGVAAGGIVRLEAPRGAHVEVTAGGVSVKKLETATGGWTEHAFDVPASVAKAETPIELTVEDGEATVFHYWFTTPLTAHE